MSYAPFRRVSSLKSRVLCYTVVKLISYTILLFASECIEKFGDVVGQQIWESINDCFDAMPVAAIIDEKVRFCHYL